jgi:hypothetical protein
MLRSNVLSPISSPINMIYIVKMFPNIKEKIRDVRPVPGLFPSF